MAQRVDCRSVGGLASGPEVTSILWTGSQHFFIPSIKKGWLRLVSSGLQHAGPPFCRSRVTSGPLSKNDLGHHMIKPAPV